MAPGLVYVLASKAMPGQVKIGKTTRHLTERCRELFTTGVPVPFSIEFAVWVSDCDELEAEVHESLDYCRVNSRREFFNLAVEEAVTVVADKALRWWGIGAAYGEEIIHPSTANTIAQWVDCHPFMVLGVMEYIPQEAWKRAFEVYLEHTSRSKEGAAND